MEHDYKRSSFKCFCGIQSLIGLLNSRLCIHSITNWLTLVHFRICNVKSIFHTTKRFYCIGWHSNICFFLFLRIFFNTGSFINLDTIQDCIIISLSVSVSLLCLTFLSFLNNYFMWYLYHLFFAFFCVYICILSVSASAPPPFCLYPSHPSQTCPISF